MKTFIFIQQNGSGILTISARDFQDALEVLEETVISPFDWRVEDEDGEDEDDWEDEY